MDKISKILLFTALLSITAFSQKLTEMHIVGNAEFISSELIDKSIKDANGETCAGLIIQSDLAGLTFNSYNGIVKVNKNPGREFLFLSPDERVVEVYCEGFASLKIILNDYGIKLESGKVWQLKITGEKKVTLGAFIVTFSTNPKDAKIIVDGTEKGTEKTLQLAKGKHNISVSAGGYKTINREIEVSESKVYFEFTLEEVDLIKVSVITNPDGAKIYLNNAEKGESNKDIWLYSGIYKIRVSKSGYLDIEKEVEVKEGIKDEVKFDLTRNIGNLSLTVQPADAEVMINNIDYTGKNTIELSPGKYQINITKPNYFPVHESIEVELGKKLERRYSLEKSTGELKLVVLPSDAEIKINNIDYTGRSVIELSPGKYQINITKPNYFSINESIEIELGKKLEKRYTLEKSTGELKLSVIPSNAEVILNNQNYTGKNTIELPAGSYQLRIAQPNYFPVSENIYIEAGKNIEKQYNLSKSTGELRLTIDPSDAEVIINKENYTGKNIIELAPGKYKIEIAKENFISTGETIDIEAGKVIEKGYNLTARIGKLQLSIQPTIAKVTIKKNSEIIKQFVGSDMLKNIQMGSYTIEAKMNGYKSLKKEITIQENQTTSLELVLEKGEDITFKTVKIVNQVWSAENLNVDRFRNGDIIPEARTNEEWVKAGKNEQPAWCYYDNQSENGEKYGKLYNWYAVNDRRGLAPEGWHIPTEEEFERLKSSVKGEGNSLKAKDEGTGEGPNTSGFSALLSGYRFCTGTFNCLGEFANFWSSMEKSEGLADYMFLRYSDRSINVSYNGNDKGNGLSVRVLKDELNNKDIDIINSDLGTNVVTTNNNIINNKGMSYKSVKIGSQIWMTENLNVDRFRNGDVIPEAKTKEEWVKAGNNEQPVWCYYENNIENGEKYGKLYNWYAVNDRRGLAPEGWHIPTKKEFFTLQTSVNGDGNSLKAEGEGTDKGVGTNESGFSALLSGYHYYAGDFNNLGDNTYFWSSTAYNPSRAYTMFLHFDVSYINVNSYGKGDGFCVRAVKDY